MRAVTIIDLASAKAQRAIIKLKRCLSVMYQTLHQSKLAIIGCYDTSNIGDLTLGFVVRKFARKQKIDCNLQCFSILKKYPKSLSILVGGGACLTDEYLSRIESRSLGREDNLAFVGVSGQPSGLRQIAFLKKASFISVRNNNDQIALMQILDRLVEKSPDITFALRELDNWKLHLKKEKSPKILGINITPLFSRLQGRQFIPDNQMLPWFRLYNPEVAGRFIEIGEKYREIIRIVVQVYISRGWEIRSIPFAIEDDLFSRSILNGLAVYHIPFILNPKKVFNTLAGCSKMICTRFHSHVFAFLSGTPSVSIAYAPKCTYLWQEMECNPIDQVERLQFVQNSKAAIEQLANSEGSTPSAEKLDIAAKDALRACEKAIRHCYPEHKRQ